MAKVTVGEIEDRIAALEADFLKGKDTVQKAYAEQAGKTLHEAVEKYRRANPSAKYSEALAIALKQAPMLAQAYAAGPIGIDAEYVPSQAEEPLDRGEIGARIHDLVRQVLRERAGTTTNAWNYVRALEEVMREHPDLAAQYRGLLA